MGFARSEFLSEIKNKEMMNTRIRSPYSVQNGRKIILYCKWISLSPWGLLIDQ